MTSRSLHNSQLTTIILTWVTEIITTNRLQISTSKSTINIITPYNREYNFKSHVTLFNAPIQVTHTPGHPFLAILGVIYERCTTFKQHWDNSHNFWALKGEHNNTIQTAIRLVLTYAKTQWSSDIANIHTHKLQTIQSIALRIDTGCARKTLPTHLHAEAKPLPLQDSLEFRKTFISLLAISLTPYNACRQRDLQT